ncbi:Acetyltransferase (GNAT) family protein [Caprobacter fermentans]|uniref:Acetyltransferase (GNAT) family protein n=1 Tax=Caproicibacter fermentans TaxID=2576756 RepID=A0A6N8I260_9FIRM|nr:GNAT family N-acetyltransferase [Caproicibacter fermentans]MVB12196.1 Acetyltransferase (GNAT) family protein [Caproicibacter fermentans]
MKICEKNGSIRILEEALLNSIPARQTILLDGWVLRMNRGYTYRANCVCPLEGEGSAGKIEACEKLFEQNRLPSVFKVTPVCQPELAEQLERRGYRKIKTVNVMSAELGQCAGESRAEIRCEAVPDREWLAASARLTGVSSPGLVETHCRGLENIAVPGVFVKAVRQGKIIGCGYGTAERGYVGIYDLHVEPEFRRGGIGTAVCGAILRFGAENGARAAYLIVHSRNQNAIRLYSSMGFQTQYEYGFYEKAGSAYQVFDA